MDESVSEHSERARERADVDFLNDSSSSDFPQTR